MHTTVRINSLFLNNIFSFNFVKQKQLDLITSKFGQTKWEKIKMYGSMFHHIGLEGFKGFKTDFKRYYFELKNKQILTQNQTHEMMRINDDIKKIGPLIIIQILPFSGPLFMLYMYTYPGSIPSWFLIDYYHDQHELLKLTNQKKAILFFQNKNWNNQNIKLSQLSLKDLRKLSLLLFGYYRDGTIGFRKLFNKKISFLICQSFSKYLIKRQLQKRFERDLFSSKITKNMVSLQQKIKWKYEKIMNGEFHFQYKPLYQKSEQVIAQREMNKEAKIFKEIIQEQSIYQINQQQKHVNSENRQQQKKK